MKLAAQRWHLQDDMVSFSNLRLRVHRIGLSHWHTGARLRSWGVAPLHRDGDTLRIPCADNEAQWLGIWLDDSGASAWVRLEDPLGPWQTTITLPPGFQITGLHTQDGREHPLVLAADGAPLNLVFTLLSSDGDATIPLRMCNSHDWARMAGRPAPAALTGPPPLSPRLG